MARGGGGPALARLARAQQSKIILLVRAIALLARSRAVDEAYRQLAAVADQAPEAARTVLTHPPVLDWAMTTVSRLDAGLNAQPETLGFVAAAAALRGRVTASLTLPGGSGIGLPSLGHLAHPGERVEFRCGPDGLRLDGARSELDDAGRPTGVGWAPLPRLRVTDRWTVLVDHPHDPLPRPCPLLGAREAARWRDQLAAGLRLLGAHDGADADDIAATVRTVAPLPAPPSGHASGTYRHAFGCLGMSPPADPRLTAVTLVHELHHMKLSALMDLFELIEPSSDLRYAPWRDDPRPPAGLLHGAYAHLGVSSFWRRLAGAEHGPARHRSLVEYVRWREGALAVCDDLLAAAPLTDVGRRFVAGMRDRMAGWRADPIPRQVTAEAARLNDEHRSQHRGRKAG